MVGAVLVHQDTIIGEGFHQAYGQAHAEVNAFNSVSIADTYKIPESSLYVSLEPCNHVGKTGACTHRIIEEKVQKVFIANLDPNPNVSGQGMRFLQSKGVLIQQGILADKGKAIIAPFIVHQTQKRPYIILKWAQSKHAYLGVKGQQVWLSNAQSKVLSHKWRSDIDAILIGANTAITDNPKLTTREYPGEDPIRVLIDPHLRVPKDKAIFGENGKVIVCNYTKEGIEGNVTYLKMEEKEYSIASLCKALYKFDIYYLLVEGGAFTLEAFIKENMWDEARVIRTSHLLSDGIKAPTLKGRLLDKKAILGDEILYIENETVK